MVEDDFLAVEGDRGCVLERWVGLGLGQLGVEIGLAFLGLESQVLRVFQKKF